MKLWEKGTKLDKEIEKFTIGNDYLADQELVEYDCIASIAHAKMLFKIGILKKSEVKKLEKELNAIIALNKKGKFALKQEDEDAHTKIENHLTLKLGALGEKIHTARSRNDQVLAALRLYSRDKLLDLRKKTALLIDALKKLAARNKNVKMPGYTHMRKAMPSSVSLWSGAFAESFGNTIKMLEFVSDFINQSPMGTAAGYGAPLEIDRKFTASLLKFGKIIENPLYAQNSRGKIESLILFAMSYITMDINKLATDLLLFSTEEFGYVKLPDKLVTGSSIMPHKKNPDALELLRAKSAVVDSYLFQIIGIAKSLPSGYNRDLQLTKEPLINGFKTTEECITVMILVISKISFDRERCEKAMTKELYATEEVYKLVKKGVPFREAYRIIGKKFVD
ncbi:argininosuccinate lyase [Candidatus Woesearchaeota archaeon]|nr:argininosuccinate lyase [Candidatus Woesearchaeota archaeon]